MTVRFFLKDPGKMARPQVLDFLLDVSKELYTLNVTEKYMKPLE